jgi:hypothetical protein
MRIISKDMRFLTMDMRFLTMDMRFLTEDSKPVKWDIMAISLIFLWKVGNNKNPARDKKWIFAGFYLKRIQLISNSGLLAILKKAARLELPFSILLYPSCRTCFGISVRKGP